MDKERPNDSFDAVEFESIEVEFKPIELLCTDYEVLAEDSKTRARRDLGLQLGIYNTRKTDPKTSDGELVIRGANVAEPKRNSQLSKATVLLSFGNTYVVGLRWFRFSGLCKYVIETT
ncbi:hypothetical protein Plhal304r1_c049g0130841 [Plasmopara halstedii]